MQCKGITTKNARCKNTVTPEKGKKCSQYCRYHKDQAKNKHENADPRIYTLVNKGPAKSDERGFIYVYYHERDAREDQSYWKIGRTTQPVEKRIAQWKNAKLKTFISVQHNKFCELLMHRMLDDVRVYRYAYEKGASKAIRFHTIRKGDGSVIMDSQNRQKDIDAKEWHTEGRTKQIEWFICPFRRVEKTLALIQKLDDAFTEEKKLKK